MRQLGIEERDVFMDKQSGKDFDREKYQAMKSCLREGDVLYIHSLDRFGRNKDEIEKNGKRLLKILKRTLLYWTCRY